MSASVRNPVVLGIIALLPSIAAAWDFTGYVNLTTDYVYRGVTRSDGHGAAQLGADISFDSGAYIGVWGSTIDIGDGLTRQRDLEVN